jgi:phosphohistidine phosphatase
MGMAESPARRAGSAGRTLVVLRHAKSAWPPDVLDHDRPLAPRGCRDAPAAGQWLRASGNVPDCVVCSTARRTRETWQLAAAELGATPPVTFRDEVYEASAATLMNMIRRTPPEVGTLLLVGHGPAMQDLTLALAGKEAADAPPGALERAGAKFPTAAIAVLAFTGAWSRLRPGQARLTGFVTPRDLGAGHRRDA